MGRRLIILGTAGNSLDILDLLESIREDGAPAFDCAGYLDDAPELQGATVRGLPVLGPLAAARELSDCVFVNGIGSPNSYLRKTAILAKTGLSADRFATIVHPSACLSRTAVLGKGSVVFPNVTISSNVHIGDQVIVLSNSVINHDVAIGNGTCIASGVCVSGGVSVGAASYLGSNSAIIENITIGDRCLVGMGSVVLDPVADDSVVAGNPARFLRRSA